MVAHLVTTPPVARQCERCGAWVLTGLAEGLRAVVDLATLTLPQQVHAMLLGTPLYWVTRTGLVHVDQSRARANDRHQVAPEHRHFIAWPHGQTGDPAPYGSTPPSDQPPY